MSDTIGRFEIRSELGRGSQSVVYLAWDPQLQREVAIKTLHFDGSDAEENAVLLDEARMVSRLRHPNAVPIYDAGEQDGDLYLVFEYVEGRSLLEALEAEGRMPAPKAANLMRQVLDAVAQAHALGIIHRDLKPSNILLDRQGVPKVMDFGIASRLPEAGRENSRELIGTPAYMAPEYITLHLREAGIDDVLGNIILRACALDPAHRFATAAEMRQALDNYLGSALAPPAAAAGAETGSQSTLDFLLRRMRHRTDFPALSDSVAAINKLTNSDRESINKLSNTILRDYGLTNKILKLVNSAYYRQAGGGCISTVSRAVIVLGFDTIRNIAITVLLFEHIQDKANARELKEFFLRSNLAALLGREASGKLLPREGEEVFICALFHGLGQLLAQYYFPEEVVEVRKLMETKGLSEAAASARVLGIAFEDLGIGIARTWGFPPAIVNSMRRLPEGPVKRPATRDETLRLLAAFSNELCQVVAGSPPEQRSRALLAVTDRFGTSLQMGERQFQTVLETSFAELGEVAAILHVNLKQSPFARQVKAFTGPSADVPGAAGTPDDEEAATLVATALGGTAVLGNVDEGADEPEVQVPEDAQAVLAAGIQDISNSLVEDFSLNDVLRITLETMYRAMGFRRVLLCLKDSKSGQMAGRFGFGADTNDLARQFRFPLSYTPDVFHLATSKAVDIIISDIDDPKIAERVPAWYRKLMPARTFVLFPLNIKGVPVAMIYCDNDRPGSIVIPERELALLKTLRNQALLAIKQSS